VTVAACVRLAVCAAFLVALVGAVSPAWANGGGRGGAAQGLARRARRAVEAIRSGARHGEGERGRRGSLTAIGTRDVGTRGQARDPSGTRLGRSAKKASIERELRFETVRGQRYPVTHLSTKDRVHVRDLTSDPTAVFLGVDRLAHTYVVLVAGEKAYRFDGNAFRAPVEVTETDRLSPGLIVKIDPAKLDVGREEAAGRRSSEASPRRPTSLTPERLEELSQRVAETKKLTCVSAACSVLRQSVDLRLDGPTPLRAEGLVPRLLEQKHESLELFVLNGPSVGQELDRYRATTRFAVRALTSLVTRGHLLRPNARQRWIKGERLKLLQGARSEGPR
jgi:hypothetical protein